jgi:RecJ-like exonuclease
VKTLISGGRTGIMEESYVFPERPRDETFEANEFSTLLNACGRHGKPDIGVRVCLGDESACGEARALLQLHRKMLREGISFATSHLQDLGPFYFLDARGIVNEGIIGIVCGMALQQSQKPVLGFSFGDGGMLKVSGRAPKALVKNGLNLGALMKKATEELGGAGGGHRMAAGASIPAGKLNEFLLLAGEYVKTVKQGMTANNG